jgi:hypothetical protein
MALVASDISFPFAALDRRPVVSPEEQPEGSSCRNRASYLLVLSITIL